jgi:hypothetical protein
VPANRLNSSITDQSSSIHMLGLARIVPESFKVLSRISAQALSSFALYSDRNNVINFSAEVKAFFGVANSNLLNEGKRRIHA